MNCVEQFSLMHHCFWSGIEMPELNEIRLTTEKAILHLRAAVRDCCGTTCFPCRKCVEREKTIGYLLKDKQQ